MTALNKSLCLWIAAFLAVLPPVAQAEKTSPMALLESMSEAMQERSYAGTFVYLHDGRMEAMRVARRSSEQGNDEKLLALNGEPREVTRRDNVVTQVLPRAGVVTVDYNRVRSQLPMSVPMALKGIDRYYQLRLDGRDRIAGRECDVVTLQPRDAYRYGRRFWIDEQSRLLVKADLLDTRGQPIEQLMYTELRVEDDLPEALFEPEFETSGMQRREIRPPEGDVLENHHWQVRQLPRGFTLSAHERRAGDHGASEHMVYSDGLATVSVFVEALAEGESGTLEGQSSIGAVNAFGRVVGDHKVVVVGEVPLVAVKQISQSVQRLAQ